VRVPLTGHEPPPVAQLCGGAGADEGLTDAGADEGLADADAGADGEGDAGQEEGPEGQAADEDGGGAALLEALQTPEVSAFRPNWVLHWNWQVASLERRMP